METTGKAPTAERLLSTLIELYADQMGVKVAYEITTSKGGEDDVSDRRSAC